MKQKSRPGKTPAEQVLKGEPTSDASALFDRGENPLRAGGTAW